MKFNRDSAIWLDANWDSGLMTRVSFDTHAYSFSDKKEPQKDNIPEVSLQLLDCSRRVVIHEFGETRDMQLEKLDKMIHHLTDFRTGLVDAWDAYDAFWAKRESKKYY